MVQLWTQFSHLLSDHNLPFCTFVDLNSLKAANLYPRKHTNTSQSLMSQATGHRMAQTHRNLSFRQCWICRSQLHRLLALRECSGWRIRTSLILCQSLSTRLFFQSQFTTHLQKDSGTAGDWLALSIQVSFESINLNSLARKPDIVLPAECISQEWERPPTPFSKCLCL